MNPLEILRSGDDDGTNYVRHISKVSAFYQCLVPGTTYETLIDLQNILRSLYERFELVPGEGNRITGLPANRYPTFSDLAAYIKEEMDVKTDEAAKADDVRKALLIQEVSQLNSIYKAISSLVRNYGQMFDGHTTIDNIVDEKIVTFDISMIKDLDNIFVAQLFNMTYFCWDNAVANGSLMKAQFENKAID